MYKKYCCVQNDNKEWKKSNLKWKSSIQFGFLYISDWSKTNYIIDKKDINNGKNRSRMIMNDGCDEYKIEYHLNIKDRFKMFNKFVRHWKLQVELGSNKNWKDFNNNFLFLMDTMNDDISKQFNCTANRWIILKNGKIVFKTPIFPSSKHIDIIDQWLQCNGV